MGPVVLSNQCVIPLHLHCLGVYLEKNPTEILIINQIYSEDKVLSVP